MTAAGVHVVLKSEVKRIPPRNRPQRAPMRTHAEMAEELGIPPSRLSSLLARHPMPKRQSLRHHSNATSTTWHEPGPMRKWFADLKEKGIV